MGRMCCATAPRFLADAIFSRATYTPLEAVERGWVHDVIEGEHALLDRAVEAANALAALPPEIYALSKRQTRQLALERMKNPDLDAAIEQIWTAPETLARVRDYVARTLHKS
jgi:enoyl-CoA hydratase